MSLLPRPEALPYLRDAKIFAAFIAKVAANLYRDSILNLLGVQPKVKRLIDEYIAANGIDPAVPPIPILDARFDEKVAGGGSSRARAREMLHAMRHHISIHMGEDPAYYETLSKKLEEILQQLRENWLEIEAALKRLIEEAWRHGREVEIEGLDPRRDAPFYGLLKKTIETEQGAPLNDQQLKDLVPLTVELTAHIQQEVNMVGFWRDAQSRQGLERWLYREILQKRLVPPDKTCNLRPA